MSLLALLKLCLLHYLPKLPSTKICLIRVRKIKEIQMKTVFKISKYLLVLLAITAFASQATSAQDSTSVKDAVQSQNFVFVAQWVNPMRGRLRQLTSYYDMYVSKDSLTSELPYFGRAFTAPINPSEAGIEFTTTKFSYDISNRKKGGWRITIKPGGVDVNQMILTVFSDGKATLQVLSNSRDAISFNGYIKANDESTK